jgi:hypothetical protein
MYVILRMGGGIRLFLGLGEQGGGGGAGRCIIAVVLVDL